MYSSKGRQYHAGINRNTFYSHYRSPEELLHSIESDVLDKIDASIAGEAAFVNTLKAIKQNEHYCTILLSRHGNRGLWEKILDGSNRRYQNDLEKLIPDLSKEIRRRITQFIVNGSIAVVHDWLCGGMLTPPEEIDILLETVVAGGLAALIKKDIH